MNLPPIDKEKATDLIAGVQGEINELKVFSEMSFDEFHKDKRNYGLAEYHLRRALEGILSIGTHILSRIPAQTKDYQQVIVSLGENGVIPRDFAEKHKKLASYRNRLVDIYWGFRGGVAQSNQGAYGGFRQVLRIFCRIY